MKSQILPDTYIQVSPLYISKILEYLEMYKLTVKQTPVNTEGLIYWQNAALSIICTGTPLPNVPAQLLDTPCRHLWPLQIYKSTNLQMFNCHVESVADILMPYYQSTHLPFKVLSIKRHTKQLWLTITAIPLSVNLSLQMYPTVLYRDQNSPWEKLLSVLVLFNKQVPTVKLLSIFSPDLKR